MTVLSRWLAPVVLAAGFGAVVTAMPTPARADDQLARVLVDVADVIVRNNTPYYRYGNYGYEDRLVVVRDRWGRPSYYRNAPRYVDYRYRPAPQPRYYGYNRYDNRGSYDRDCNRHGKCRTTYYDARYDRHYDNRYDNRYYDRHDGRGHGNGNGRWRRDD